MSQIISANISCSRTQSIYFCSVCNTLLISVQIQTKKRTHKTTTNPGKKPKSNKNILVKENSDESTLTSSVTL